MCKKYVYLFNEGNEGMRNLLGGKGANLACMTNLKIPVPYGFTITTEGCTSYYENGEKLSNTILNEIDLSLTALEYSTGKTLGSLTNPLLISVRSGARVSMPGMMDTILNLGLNDKVTAVLGKLTNNERFAYDSYRRFIQMFSDVVMGIDKRLFEEKIEALKASTNSKLDTDLTSEHLKNLVSQFKEIYKNEKGEDFPQNPKTQLIQAITAVFKSWNNERAIIYRKLNDIPDEWGTAVTVQEMVFGNKGTTSGTGVIFSRNPATGENKIYGEYLMNAQGEDVVAGIRTPLSISKLEEENPNLYKELLDIVIKLENYYKDMQDMEITIEEGKLYFLQTRNGKRTASAAIKIATSLVNEGMITKEESILKVEPKSLDSLLHQTFLESSLKSACILSTGLPASPGAACGKIAFSTDEVKERISRGEKVILIRLETSPEDIEGMLLSEGILTVRGGMTSHAAVVARGMGICCVSGCSSIKINEKERTIEINNKIFSSDDYLSIDGSTGNIYGEKIKTTIPSITGDFKLFMSWVDEIRDLKVKTNADNAKDAAQAILFGADGIGLCRTEHMFFSKDRILEVRKMILSTSLDNRIEALNNILPMQRADFIDIYEALEGRSATIRLLDPPLHEFLPHTLKDIEDLAKSLNVSTSLINETIKEKHEFNPMMGHRGCRLLITYPEITKMQTRAILEAAIDVSDRKGYNIIPEIMIPLIGDVNELKFIKDIISETADKVFEEKNTTLKYKVGTMIEIPRACITADKIGTIADFFSFGTNDLTQMTFGFSRDDASKFLSSYYKNKIYTDDPFAKLDQNGVGELIKIAKGKVNLTNPNISLGICGEQGGDPSSIEFCHKIGLNYVSCSPFRVPLARLAAAQSKIKNK